MKEHDRDNSFYNTSTFSSRDPVSRGRLFMSYFCRRFFHFMPFSFAISGGRRTERTVGTSLILLCRLVRTIPFLYLVRFSRRKRAASASAECMSAIQNCFAVVVPCNSDFVWSCARRCRCRTGSDDGGRRSRDLTCSSTSSCSATVFPSDGL